MDTIIRPLKEEDIPDVLRLLREFAEYERLSEHCLVDEQRMRMALFGAEAFVEGIVAERGGSLIGYSLFFPYFSSFRGERGLYVDDLYLAPAARSGGLGKRMLAAVAKRAMERGFERIDFLVHEGNRAAIEFYQRLGATHNEGEQHFKIAGEAFKTLAELDD